jgi:hypothetical protein
LIAVASELTGTTLESANKKPTNPAVVLIFIIFASEIWLIVDFTTMLPPTVTKSNIFLTKCSDIRPHPCVP